MNMTLCRYLGRLLLGCFALLAAPWAAAVTCSEIFPQDMKENGVVLDLGFLSDKDLKPFPSKTQSLQSSGDLFFNGGSLGNGQVLSVQTGPGVTTRIFVQGDLTLEPHSSLNPLGVPENLILIVNGTLTIKADQQTPDTINALIYAVGDVSLGNGIKVKGAITSRGKISYHQKSSVEYDGDAVAKADFGSLLCNGGNDTRVDHYRLSYSSQALTCQPHKVAITACANADCSLEYTDGPSRLSLTPGGWNSAVFNFLGSTTGHLSVRREGVVTLGITGIPEPTAQQPLKCLVDGAPSASCVLRFSKSGFRVDVPDFISGQAVTASIQAVEADVDNPAVCRPAFDSGTRKVGLSFSYIDPKASEEQGRQLLTVANATLSQNKNAPNLHDLTFSMKDGRAATAELESLSYLDVGRLQLNVSYLGAGAEEGLELSGSTDFVVRPASLSVFASDAPACDPERDFSMGNCTKYKAADDSFELTVKALNGLGNEVKNFRHSDVALEVVAEAGNDRFYPRAGRAPEIMPSTYEHEISQQNVSARINEVGIVKIRATAADYLSSGSDIVGVSDFIGRFTPDRFAIEVEQYEPICNAGAFTYAGLDVGTPGMGKQGQPFILYTQVKALSVLGTVTENYDGSLEQGRFSPLEGESLSVQGVVKEAEGMWGDAVDGYPVASNTLRFGKGVAAVTFDRPMFYFKKVRGPYDVSLVLTATDNEDQVSGSSAPTEPLEFRLGQAHIGNAHGSEMQDLLLPFSVRYFDGEQYIPNLLDNCTLFTPASLGEFKRTGSGSGEPDLIYLNANGVADSPFVVSAGRSGLGGYLLSAPKSSGSVLVTYEDVPDWLKYDWDGDGSVEPPSGLATFGIYKGPKPLIFRREVYR